MGAVSVQLLWAFSRHRDQRIARRAADSADHVEPAIDQTRFVQIAYTAAWVPVRDGSTKVYLRMNAESALIDWGCVN